MKSCLLLGSSRRSLAWLLAATACWRVRAPARHEQVLVFRVLLELIGLALALARGACAAAAARCFRGRGLLEGRPPPLLALLAKLPTETRAAVSLAERALPSFRARTRGECARANRVCH